MPEKSDDIPPVSIAELAEVAQTSPLPDKVGEAAQKPDFREPFNEVSARSFEQLSEIAKLKAKLQTKDELDKLISPYARRAFSYMCVYSVVVAAILLMVGFRLYNFYLSDSILQFLVGSTAVTVVGLVGMVLTGIFVGARPKGE